MIPMRSEQEEGTGVTFATGRPRLVTRMPSDGRPSSSWRHCSRKSLTFKVFMSQVYRKLYTSTNRQTLRPLCLDRKKINLSTCMAIQAVRM